jgi:hypothetical protein
MQLHEVKQVKQVVGEDKVNEALAEGWTLMSVVTFVPGVGPVGGQASSVTYVLGKPAEPAKTATDLNVSWVG